MRRLKKVVCEDIMAKACKLTTLLGKCYQVEEENKDNEKIKGTVKEYFPHIADIVNKDWVKSLKSKSYIFRMFKLHFLLKIEKSIEDDIKFVEKYQTELERCFKNELLLWPGKTVNFNFNGHVLTGKLRKRILVNIHQLTETFYNIETDTKIYQVPQDKILSDDMKTIELIVNELRNEFFVNYPNWQKINKGEEKMYINYLLRDLNNYRNQIVESVEDELYKIDFNAVDKKIKIMTEIEEQIKNEEVPF
ncbi:MAG: hypothetical protein ACFFDH_00340 [Promethearchaeota archaeon]